MFDPHTDQGVQTIVGLSASCDQGHALQAVLDLLVEADLDHHLTSGETDDEAASREAAETALWRLAVAHAAEKRRYCD